MLREQEAVGSSPAIGNKNQGSGLIEGHNWGPSEPVASPARVWVPPVIEGV